METKAFCHSCHYHTETEITEVNSHCPKCGCILSDEIPQWQQNLDKAQGKQTGPGNTSRTSANAKTHGLYATKHKWFPAKKDKNPECDGCPYYDECKPSGWCWLRNQVYNEVQIAFETGDTDLLKKYVAQDQTKLIFIRTMVMNEILQKGGMIPRYMQNNLGELVLDEKGKKIISGYTPNPLLSFVDKLINISNAKMEDYLMTPKTKKESVGDNPEKGRLTPEEYLELFNGMKKAMKEDDRE